VLEVRSHEVPFILEDGQMVASLVFERLLERPRLLYGEGIGSSSYQRQGLKLSKHFKDARMDRACLSFDVVGVGLNATDTMLVVPHFPAYGGKVPFLTRVLFGGRPGGHGVVACAKLGCARNTSAPSATTSAAHPAGKPAWRRHQSRSRAAARNCPNQSAYIVIDESTGERTVFWSRPDCLRIAPKRLSRPSTDPCARLLHIDGHDTPAVEHAARIARARGIPVTVDVDTIYPGFDRVLPLVDYLIASSEFPARWTGIEDPFEALAGDPGTTRDALAAMTLGAHGALALRRRPFFTRRLRGELRRYHRRGRRLPRGLLLCCFAADASRRSAGIRQRHGRAELHGGGRARPYCDARKKRAHLIARGERRGRPEIAGRARVG
jgi:sulfofructose kinase